MIAVRTSSRRVSALLAISFALLAAAAVATAIWSGGGASGRAHASAQRAASGAGRHRHIIPWINARPAAEHHQRPRLRAGAGPRVTGVTAACTADDLTTSVAQPIEGMGGQLSWSYKITNASGTACQISSSVTALRQGSTQMSYQSLDDASAGLSPVAVLAAGQSATLPAITSADCSSAPAASGSGPVEVTTSNGLTLSFELSGGSTFSDSCGLSVGQFGTAAPPTSESTNALDNLQLSIAGVSPDSASHDILYEIVLKNRTSSAISLANCGGYHEYAAGNSGGLSMPIQSYELNCAAAPATIPAGGSLTFAMKGLSFKGSGEGKLGWSLDNTTLSAGFTLNVPSS